MSKIGGTPVPTNTLGYNMYGMTTQNPKGDSQNPKSGWAGTVGQIAGAVASGIPNVYDYNDNESIYNDAIYGDAGMDTWARAFDIWSGNGMNRALNKIGTGREFNPFYSKEDAINAWDNNMFKSNVDYTNPLLSWQGWVDNAKAGLAGMSKGSAFGPWGMLGGLASEGTLHWLTQIGSKDRADKLNKAIDQYNINSIVNYGNELDAMNARNIFNQKRNYIKAEGGSLDESNGVTTFRGLKHGQFGLDGIPQGIASDGIPNYVQGGGFDKNGNPLKGEIKYKDYIYGELKITKKLADKYHLPEKWVGLKYQEAADNAQQESKDRPNDPISLKSLDEWMTRLQGAQEEQKLAAATKEAAKAVDNMSDEEKAALLSSLEQPMAQQEDIDLSQPMYAKGGKIYIKPKNRGKFTALKKRTGKSASWFKAHGTPAQKKMATFALNARKWKHADGGHLAQRGMYLDIPPYDYNVIEPEIWKNLDLNVVDVPRPDISWLSTQPLSSYIPVSDNIPPRQELILAAANPATTTAALNKLRDNVELENAKHQIALDLSLLNDKAQRVKPNILIGDYKNTLTSGFTAPLIKKDNKKPLGVTVSQDKVNPDAINNSTINNFNGSMLRYMPAVGAGIGALAAVLQPKDYELSNREEQLAEEFKPISLPHIGGERKTVYYDTNLGDAENIALQAQALEANRGLGRATRGALNTAIINKFQEANAKRNLAAQQANEASSLATDTYNLGIRQFNAQQDDRAAQLNQQILNNRINMLLNAAQTADASRAAWNNNVSSTAENYFNQFGNVGRDELNRNQRDALLTALGAEGIKELLRTAEGRAWLAQNGYYNS